MPMIRTGDRVAPILELHREAKVLEIKQKKHTTMLVGGTLSTVSVAVVQIEKTGEITEWHIRDLMRLD